MYVDRVVGMVTRGINNPQVPLTSRNIIEYLTGGNNSRSGVPVTEQTTLSVPALFNGTRILSEAAMKLPLVVYRRLPSGGKERDRNHSAHQLLADSPNGTMATDIWIQLMVANAILHGRGVSYIQRRNSGAPVRIFWLDPMLTHPIVKLELDREGRLLNRSIEWNVAIRQDDGGHTKYLFYEDADIFHLRGFSTDDVTGKSVIRLLADAIGTSIAKQRYTSVFFQNDAAPSVVLKVPWTFDDPLELERFRKAWKDRHAGSDNAHNVAILEGGAEVSPFSVNPRDAQMVETQEFSLVDAANILGLPASMLNADVASSYNSLEFKNRDFVNFSIGPWLHKIEAESKRKLLTGTERQSESHVIEFLRDDLERADRNTEATSAVTLVNGGINTVNEVRSKWNLPAIDGGDNLRVPLNLGYVGDDGEIVNPNASESPEPPEIIDEPEPMPEDDSDRAADMVRIIERKMTQSLERVANRITLQQRKATRDAKSFATWCDGLVESNSDAFVGEIAPFVGNAFARRWADDLLSELQNGLIELSGEITEERLADSVGQHLRAWSIDNQSAWHAGLMEVITNGA